MSGEIEFPFDIKGFTKKVNQMSDALSSIGKKVETFGKSVEKHIIGGLTKGLALVGGLVKGFQSITKNMPELTQAFKLASEIVTKEFFFPIRQMVMPYLQKMLDWVRDHRAMFAKWGTLVAQVLRTVIDVAKILWDTMKGIIDTVTGALQKGLNTSFKSLDEFMNVLALKLTVVAMLVGDAMKNLLSAVSPVLEYVIEKGLELADSLAPKIGQTVERLMDTLKKLVTQFGEIGKAWLETNEDGNSLITILNTLYDIFDKVLTMGEDAVTSFVEGISPHLINLVTPVQKLVNAFDDLTDAIMGEDDKNVKRAFTWLGDTAGKWLTKAVNGLTAVIQSATPWVDTYLNKIGGIVSKVEGYIEDLIDSLGELAMSWLTPNENGSSFYTILDKIFNICDKLVTIIGSALSGLFEGLSTSLTEIMTPIDTLLGAFDEMIGKVSGNSGSVKSAFKTLGEFLGGTFTFVLSTVALAVDTLISGIVILAEAVAGLIEWGSNPFGGVPQSWKDLKQTWSNYTDRVSTYSATAEHGVKTALFGSDYSTTTNNNTAKIEAPIYVQTTVNTNNPEEVTQVIVETTGNAVADRILRTYGAGGW